MNSSFPLVSIVTPSFNQGRFLAETIESVLSQGYPRLQYIIIDGGSTDESVEIIKRYQQHLDFWVSESDSGQAHALNKGFSVARGDLLAFLNSDDCYLPGALKSIVERFRLGGCPRRAIVCGEVIDFDESGHEWHWRNNAYGPPSDWVKWMDEGANIHQPGAFWTQDVHLNAGPFREDLRYNFDRYFFAKARMLGASYLKIDEPVSRFRLHGTSKTVAEGGKFKEEWLGVQQDLLDWAGLPMRMRIALESRLLSFQRANWRTVDKALQSPTRGPALRILFERVSANPLSLMHRPVAAALGRLILRPGKSR